MSMAVQSKFTAFCSAILNSKTAQRQFMNPLKQKELFAKYGLTRSQMKAVKSKDIDAITLEFKKEISKAIRIPPIDTVAW